MTIEATQNKRLTTHIIIIRGNSGSGKSTVARELRARLENVMLISQDTIRREILNVKDTKGNPAIALIEHITNYGIGKYHYIIIEGILAKERYLPMLSRFNKINNSDPHFIYLNISFDETLRRHNTRSKSSYFGKEKLIKWWLNDDQLNVEREIIISDKDSVEHIVQSILNEIDK